MENIFNSLSIDDKLSFMKTLIPCRFEPAETIDENGDTIQGIVLTFLKGNGGGDVNLLCFRRGEVREDHFPINRTRRISWNDYSFVDKTKNTKTKLLNVFLKDGEYYICLMLTKKTFETKPKKCLLMYNLSCALKDDNDIVYAPVDDLGRLGDEYIPLDGKTNPNDPSTKDYMFSCGHLTNLFIL